MAGTSRFQATEAPSALRTISGRPNGSSGAAEEALFLLAIALSGEECAQLGSTEQLNWIAQAEALGAPLVIRVGEGYLELYSTGHARVLAFRPALLFLARRIQEKPALRAARTFTKCHSGAARHLLRHIARLEVELPPGQTLNELDIATPTIVASAALPPVLAELLRAAVDVERRVSEETTFLEATSTHWMLEVEALSATRIVEEALVAWQVLQGVDLEREPAAVACVAELNRVRPGQRTSSFPEEPASGVHRKVSFFAAPSSNAPLLRSLSTGRRGQ